MLTAALVAAVLTTAVALGAAGTKSSGLPVIDVSMDGSSISMSGTLVSGAVNVHLVATRPASGSPAFVRLNDGVSAGQFLAFLNSKKGGPWRKNIARYGSIVFDVGGPGRPSPATHDIQTKLQPGDYVALDTATTYNPAHWPNTTFSISENPSPASLPPAQQWQKSLEFRFRGPATLHTGQVIRVSNEGWRVHMMLEVGVKNEAVGREAIQLLRAGQDSKLEKLPRGGHGDIPLFESLSHGAVQQFVLTLKPGWYVEACFMHTQDGREHTRLGMERLIHIVR